MALHNRVNQKELRLRMLAETEPRTTISFYRYLPISDPKDFRDRLYQLLNDLRVFGRVYVAAEGINAQVSVPVSRFTAFQDRLAAVPGLDALRLNVAVDDDGRSFWVLKIKVREKIVADGIKDPSFHMGRKGKYVNAAEFNRLTDDPATIVVDMRNHYEFEVGHFDNAIEIPSDTFRDQLPMSADMLKEKKASPIIMYCTGGIRCEKASAWLLHQGFTNVYHLEGGIIHYANTVREQGLENKFRGKNFVFDDRMGERISEEVIAACHQCGRPADTHTNCRNEACHLLFIQCEECAARFEGCCSAECQSVTHLPSEERRRLRQGAAKGRHTFNKSRSRLK
ncbi:MAG TPA: rhodanese-related sulfurtransferase [Puia sp.]|nr:rhodanese-related sulfurtransferase [Puia sp.]